MHTTTITRQIETRPYTWSVDHTHGRLTIHMVSQWSMVQYWYVASHLLRIERQYNSIMLVPNSMKDKILLLTYHQHGHCDVTCNLLVLEVVQLHVMYTNSKKAKSCKFCSSAVRNSSGVD